MSAGADTVPSPIRAFVNFVQLLRANGFAVAPDQTIGFIEALGLLGPNRLSDIRNAGIAMLAIPRERWDEYDALFRAFFLDQTVAAPADPADQDEAEAHDMEGGTRDVEMPGDELESGQEVSRAEQLSHRQFIRRERSEVLRTFSRQAPDRLPRRKSRRWKPRRHGDRIDLRANARRSLQREGEVFDLALRSRKLKQRPITLLIDVSGSMKEQSESFIRLAHAIVQRADRPEVFTLGTRLTRITPALRNRQVETALDRVSALVADFDGGTRIGDALQALLAVPRFAASLRGALTLVLSDGLERGDPTAMVDAVAKISRLAWRQDWLSPLAGQDQFVPRTEALKAALPYMDSLSSAENLQTVVDHILSAASTRTRRRAA